MEPGYCTVDDVRKVFQEASLSGALAENSNQLVVDAIKGWTDQLQTWTHKHWFDGGGSIDDPEGVLATDTLTREDEHDFSTHAATVDGEAEEPRYWNRNSDDLLEQDGDDWRYYRDREIDKRGRLRISFGDFDPRFGPENTTPAYTRIRLNRKDVTAVNELMVVNSEAGFDDWTGPDYDGGVGNSFRGDDWWVRVNNRGVSELYIDVQALPDDIPSLSKAVYVDFDFGDDEIPMSVRRGVAHLAAAQLVIDEEFQGGLPENGQLINVETKSEKWERQGYRLLDKHFVTEPPEVGQA